MKRFGLNGLWGEGMERVEGAEADHIWIIDFIEFILGQTSRLCEKRELTRDSP